MNRSSKMFIGAIVLCLFVGIIQKIIIATRAPDVSVIPAKNPRRGAKAGSEWKSGSMADYTQGTHVVKPSLAAKRDYTVSFREQKRKAMAAAAAKPRTKDVELPPGFDIQRAQEMSAELFLNEAAESKGTNGLSEAKARQMIKEGVIAM